MNCNWLNIYTINAIFDEVKFTGIVRVVYILIESSLNISDCFSSFFGGRSEVCFGSFINGKLQEGFCWNNLLNPNARLLKVKLKGESVNDVGSMSLYTTNILSNKYIVALLNSNILFDYYREFINCSVNVQINDIKQLPIIIPTKSLASSIELWADKAIKKKQESANENLEPIEVEIEDLIKILYSI